LWNTPVIPALERQKQKFLEFKNSLGYACSETLFQNNKTTEKARNANFGACRPKFSISVSNSGVQSFNKLSGQFRCSAEFEYHCIGMYLGST
jgi:hypothetical protein